MRCVTLEGVIPSLAPGHLTWERDYLPANYWTVCVYPDLTGRGGEFNPRKSWLVVAANQS